MADIKNLEKNIELVLSFYKNQLFDYDSERNIEECWIPFTLNIMLPQRIIEIDKIAEATMTVYEVKRLILGFESILQSLNEKKEMVFKFYSIEAFFELKMETVPEDNVVEIEIWINVGSQTNGNIYGYDEGIRFISEKKAIMQFLANIKQEVIDILQD